MEVITVENGLRGVGFMSLDQLQGQIFDDLQSSASFLSGQHLRGGKTHRSCNPFPRMHSAMVQHRWLSRPVVPKEVDSMNQTVLIRMTRRDQH